MVVLLFFVLQILPALAAVVNHTFEINYFQLDPDGHGAAWVQGINGILPGPEIRVRRYDQLHVTVVNQLQTEGVTIHWHGFEMRGAQEYDGVMGVTQCAIKPGSTSVYDFIVDEEPGTYMYHHHAGVELVASHGVTGALIVEPEIAASYDAETVLHFMEWVRVPHHEQERKKQALMTRPNTLNVDGNVVGVVPFHNLLINGKGAFNVFAPFTPLSVRHVTDKALVESLEHIMPRFGETRLLRLINAGVAFSMRFRIDGHKLLVIAADGSDVVPYECDAVTMSSGERFDVLVAFDRTPGSYWMRVETLEEAPGLHHGQLGIVQYQGTFGAERPDRGFPQRHRIKDAPELVTLNCVDQGPWSEVCLPITVLRPLRTSNHVGKASQATHDFEVSLRGFGGTISNSHFTRVLDLAHGNPLGEDQFEGEFVQFAGPSVPYSYVNGSTHAEHPNTLSMEVKLGEIVRVVIQQQDRVAHPWHLHGHKFAVLGTGMPDYSMSCDVLYCRSKVNHWISRDGFPGDLLDPEDAPLKDTIYLPAGGWAVLQFEADNPGWWLFHCHMINHVHDGMGLVVHEAVDHIPSRLTNKTYLESTSLPSCNAELQQLDIEGASLSCDCWQNPEMKLNNMPLSSYKCSQSYLCGNERLVEEEPWVEWTKGLRNRAGGRYWRITLLCGELTFVLSLFLLKLFMGKRQKAREAYLLLLCSGADIECELEEEMEEGLFATCLSEAAALSSCEVGSVHASAFTSNSLSGNGRRCSSYTNIARHTDKLATLHHAGHAIKWTANKESAVDGVSRVVKGNLPVGSVLSVLGLPHDTEPWLRFLAGRKQPESPCVVGELCIDDVATDSWQEQSLCQARCYIEDTDPVRPTCTVGEVLELPLMLNRCPDLFNTNEERDLHLAMMIDIFGLHGVLSHRLESLNAEMRLTVTIAQEMMLPRSLLIIRNPFSSLPVLSAERMSHIFNLVASKLNVTVVFSCCTCMTLETGRSISHALFLKTANSPVFGTAKELADFLRSNDSTFSLDACSIAWASEIVAKGLYIAEERERRTVYKSTRASLLPAAHYSAGFSVRESIWAGGKASWFSKARRATRTLQSASSSSQLQLVWQTRSSPLQLWVLLQYQSKSSLITDVTVFRFVETMGIGVMAGIVWFQKGSSDTQTALGETIGLFFFSTALYTVPPVFQALAQTPAIVTLVKRESLNGMYSIHIFVMAMILALPGTLIWPALWLICAYTFADCGASISSMLMMQLILVMNVLVMRFFGYVMAILIPKPVINTVTANLMVQSFMLTNGFYTKLPAWLPLFILNISVPRWTFRALLKLEYSWKDSFLTNPMQGFSARGYPTKYIPAEITGIFQTLAERQMDVMQSPHDSTPAMELMVLSVFFLVGSLLFTGALRLNVRTHLASFQQPQMQPQIPSDATFVPRTSILKPLSNNNDMKTLSKTSWTCTSEVEESDDTVLVHVESDRRVIASV